MICEITTHAVNPRKSPTIKAEIEKLLKDGFIYPIPLTEWVSNPILVDKKQGEIRICTDFRDLNNACCKDNFLTPCIDQILDECVGSEVFSFMDGFFGYDEPYQVTNSHAKYALMRI